MTPNVEPGIAERGVLQSAIDALPMNVAVLDAEGTIRSTNSTWQEFADANGVRTHPEMLGVDYLAVVEAADDVHATRAAAGLRDVLAGERSEFELEYPCHSSDRKRWFLMRAIPFTHDGRRYVTVAHADVTERRLQETTLRDAAEIVADPELSFGQRVDALLELGREALGLEYATLSYVHDDEYDFEAVAAPPDSDITAGMTVPLDATNCERVVATGERLALRDIETEAPELADRAGNDEFGISTYLGVPIFFEGDACGTVCFYDSTPRSEPFSDWEIAFVDLLGDWMSREIERRRYVEQFAALGTAFPDLGFVLDTEGRYLDCLVGRAVTDLLYVDPDELLGRTLQEVLPADTAEALLETVREAVATGGLQTVEYELDVKRGTRWFEGRVAPLTDGGYGPEAVVVVARDVTERRTRERALERQRDELRQLQRINALIRGITQSLQNATTRDGIETAVCERLTGSDLYETAWIGTEERPGTDDGAVAPRTSAGKVPSSHLPERRTTIETALRSGDVRVAGGPRIPENPSETEANGESPADRRPGADPGGRALVAVPLTTGETTYGVLVVGAPPEHPIDEAERDVLADLGRMIALAIQRVESQRSLTAATAVELQLEVGAADSAVAAVTDGLDCELAFERQTPLSDGRSLQYFTVSGADPSLVCDRLARTSFADACSVVRDDGPALVELDVGDTGRSVIDVLIDQGVSIGTARAADGKFHVTAEVAPERDVRTVVAAVRNVAPSVELVSKRLTDRPVTTLPDFRTRVDDLLTSKQQAALATAHIRGYYDWPRGSTAEELAEAMEISSSTLHYHLRHGVDALLTAFFEQSSLR